MAKIIISRKEIAVSQVASKNGAHSFFDSQEIVHEEFMPEGTESTIMDHYIK